MHHYIYEFLTGGIITALFSYTASLFSYYPGYIKIVAFLWGMPLLYFYILYISLYSNTRAAFDTTRHGLYGVITSMFLLSTTILFMKYVCNETIHPRYLVWYNLFALIAIIWYYLYYKIYDL